MKWGVVKANPVPASDAPTPNKKQGLALTPLQQSLVLQAAEAQWGLSAFLELAAATGARRGELLALEWSDLDGNRLTIARSLSQTKTGLTLKAPKNGNTPDVDVARIGIGITKSAQEATATASGCVRTRLCR